jgi:hypothetical protein
LMLRPKSRQKVSNREFLNHVPLSLRIARIASSCLSFFNLKVRSQTKPNVSSLSAKKKTQAAWVVIHYHKDIPLPSHWAHVSWTNQVHMEQLAWTLCHDTDQGRMGGGYHLPCLRGAHTKTFWNFNLGNPLTKPSPLKRDNKSKLKWPSLLCHFQCSAETPATKQHRELTDWEKSTLKIWPSGMIVHTRSPQEYKTWEAPVLKRTSNPHQEARIQREDSTQRLDKINTLESHSLTHLHRSHWKHSTFPIVPKSDVLLGHHQGEAGEPPSISGHVSRATGVDQPKTLHASHLQNQKWELEWEWANDSALD